MIKVTINGTIEAIKREVQIQQDHLIEFIVVNREDKRPHHFLLRAITKGSTKDKYKISQLIGQEISADCFLNGRKSENNNSAQPYYNNDLKVFGLTTV